jgi:hypothetical protein
LKAEDKNYKYDYKNLVNWVFGEEISNGTWIIEQNIWLDLSIWTDCSKYDINICNQIAECRICPPCEECSSISCQQNNVCEEMWFTQEWSENVRKSNNRN